MTKRDSHTWDAVDAFEPCRETGLDPALKQESTSLCPLQCDLVFKYIYKTLLKTTWRIFRVSRIVSDTHLHPKHRNKIFAAGQGVALAAALTGLTQAELTAKEAVGARV